ncbi:DUF5655 domain-containing protein [Mucilaginibacter rubeus]|uniref:DUF5655 domain-containing protein n=1 Tax=Mucilaginibacter rubeus TaxID=2027860 RepID=UPI0016652C29|nr:DUF5655 domain-containing protein [Mucilaginibacter rubeus]GGB10593.1 hypothetical protein GCM10011500_27920 [Mucilaginibacter rubeus]
MPLYSNNKGKLQKLNLISLDKEKALQKLVEENLLEILDIKFLYSEYPTTHGGRIDTLAIDSEGAPVILEYKRNRNDNVINQALSYLKWLKSQKVEFFERLVVKKLGDNNSIEIDWHHPRVICIAESYSKYDIDTLEIIPLRLELYKYHYYENDIFALDKVNGDDEKIDSTIIVSKKKESIKEFNLQIKQNDSSQLLDINLERQLNKAQPFVKELFFDLRKTIFELDENIYEKANANNIAFRISKMFVEVHIQTDNVLIYLRPINYNDPLGKVFKVPDTHRWTLNRGLRIRTVTDLNYAAPLIEKSYQDIL